MEMMKYAKLIDGKLTLFRNPLQKDGMDIYNPSAEVLAGEGYKPYTEEDVDSSRLDACDLGFEYQETDTGIRKVWVYIPNMKKAKAAKLAELEAAFNTASQKAHCASSAGFEIDADEIANRNIEGLVLVMQPEETTLFRAYDNSFHEVTREQLEIMRKEIVINSQYLYQAKWTIEAQIMQAQTAQAVADIDISADTIAALANTLKAQAMEGANGEEGAGNAEAS